MPVGTRGNADDTAEQHDRGWRAEGLARDGHADQVLVSADQHLVSTDQALVSTDKLSAKIGRRMTVLVDEVDDNGVQARSKGDAPEIDGSVFLNGEFNVKPGEIVSAKVVEADDYDLWAERQ